MLLMSKTWLTAWQYLFPYLQLGMEQFLLSEGTSADLTTAELVL